MKKILTFIIVLTIAISASSCFPTGEIQNGNANQTGGTQGPGSEMQSDTESESPIDEEITAKDIEAPAVVEDAAKIAELREIFGEPTELKSGMVPKTYQAVISDSISINASVTVPDNIDFGKFTASVKSLPNAEKICEVLLGDNVEFRNEYGGIDQYYTDDNGARLYINDGAITYTAGGDNYCRRNLPEKVVTRSYGGFVRGLNRKYREDLADTFTKTEIEGLDRQDAVSLAKEKLQSLGLVCESEPQIYVIDSETVSNSDFTADDDAYFIIFNHSYQGMPISTEPWRNDKSNYLSASNFYAVVTKQGLIDFSAYQGYTVTEEKTETAKLYNADILEKALKKHFGTIPLISSYNFTDMRLEYVCLNPAFNATKGLVFVPCWVCGFTADGELGSPGVIFINAMTGEFLDTQSLDNII